MVNTVWHASALKLHKINLLHSLAICWLKEMFSSLVIPKTKGVSATKRGELCTNK